jgi:hypothetical protein
MKNIIMIITLFLLIGNTFAAEQKIVDARINS